MDNPGIINLGTFDIGAAGPQVGDWTSVGNEGLELAGLFELDVQFRFLYGAGGESVTAWLQTSLDQGDTAIDLWCFQGLLVDKTRARRFKPDGVENTPGDGSLVADTIATGIVLGDRYRVKLTSTGVYTANTKLVVRGHAR